MGGHLIVGVGGSGQRIIGELKRRTRHASSSSERNLRFLAIDTDRRQPDSQLSADEFIHLTVGDTRSFINGNSFSVREWLDVDYLPLVHFGAINIGAGQIRALGRLAFLANLDQVLAVVRTRLSELAQSTHLGQQRDTPLEPASIVFCGSIAGGTGGGVLLDLASAVRTLPEADGFTPVAYLLLPGAFRGGPLTRHFGANAYAFVKEIDHLLAYRPGPTNPNPFRVSAGRRGYSLMCPFARVTLVDNTNTQGVTFNIAELVDLAVSAIAFECQSRAGYEIANEWTRLRDKNTAKLLPYPYNSPYWAFGYWPLDADASGAATVGADELRERTLRAMMLSSPLLAYDRGDHDVLQPYLVGPTATLESCEELLGGQLGWRERTLCVESPGPVFWFQVLGPLQLDRVKAISCWQFEYEHHRSGAQSWSLHLDKRWEQLLPEPI